MLRASRKIFWQLIYSLLVDITESKNLYALDVYETFYCTGPHIPSPINPTLTVSSLGVVEVPVGIGLKLKEYVLLLTF